MRTNGEGAPFSGAEAPLLSPADWQIIGSVDQYLADALLLKRWWLQADSTQSYAQRYDLERTFNRPDRSYGFFDSVPASAGGCIPLMGSVQEMFYDQPRAPAGTEQSTAAWMRDQIREFVMHYFMRVSSFRGPETVVATDPEPRNTGRFSWCPDKAIHRKGFGFSQHYFKLRNGTIGRFPPGQEFAIVDMRELRSTYEWIVAKVRIFDFDFRTRPFGEKGPEVVFGLNEESYLVLNADLITLEEDPSLDTLGRYGVGYGFIRSPGPSAFAYGPGQFQAAFELIRFCVDRSGKVTVKMVFVANRPHRIGNFELRPLEWGFDLADAMTMGLSSRLLWPFQQLAKALPFRLGPFDPVYTFIALANTLTAGAAAREFCISRDQLDKRLLLQHFIQHYNTIVSSLLTWRQIPDWLQESALPEWVITGRSS